MVCDQSGEGYEYKNNFLAKEKIPNRKGRLCFLCFFCFVTGIHSMKGLIATTRHGNTRKRSTKRLKVTRNMFRMNLNLKDVY